MTRNLFRTLARGCCPSVACKSIKQTRQHVNASVYSFPHSAFSQRPTAHFPPAYHHANCRIPSCGCLFGHHVGHRVAVKGRAKGTSPSFGCTRGLLYIPGWERSLRESCTIKLRVIRQLTNHRPAKPTAAQSVNLPWLTHCLVVMLILPQDCDRGICI